MMLYVNGEEITEIVFGLFTKSNEECIWRKLPERFLSSPEEYLKKLTEYLSSNIISLDDLEGVALASGYGSATALRASHAIINTLSFMKGFPLFFIEKRREMSDEDALLNAPLKEVSFLAPKYERAPHITKTDKDALRR